MNNIPEPQDGVDFYVDELRRYTVSIEVSVDGYPYGDSDAEICSRAVDLFRDGSTDSDSTVVCSEKIRDVELDFETDMPFSRAAWQEAKLAELGLNIEGKPLRPGEKERPKTEKTLGSWIIWR